MPAHSSPPWLPRRIAHADWGSAPGKRVVVTAELHDGAYLARAPAVVGRAGRLLEWCAENAVIPHEDLAAHLLDGFGPRAAGEDQFDAVVGLFGMIDTVRRRAEPELPADPAIVDLEGWIFGQHAVCP
jgi:hypothetical protein